MYPDRRQLKASSKEVIARSKPSVVLVALVYVLIIGLVDMLSLRLLQLNVSVQQLQTYMDHVANGDLDYALALLERMQPPGFAMALSTLMDVVTGVIGLGFIIFLLNSIRSTAPCFGNLLDGFGVFFKYIGLSILTGLFIGLWSLLLVIPGIVAAYRYRMAVYLLADDRSLGVRECLRRSKAMMAGHKWELFVMDLSFIGWALLAGIPYVGYVVQLWTVPYISTCYAMFYEKLRTGGQTGTYAPNAGPSDPPPWEM